MDSGSTDASANEKKLLVGSSLLLGENKLVKEACTLKFEIDDFEDLPHEVGDCVKSPCFHCHGCSWRLHICHYPDGLTAEERVAVRLELVAVRDPDDRRARLSTKLVLRMGLRLPHNIVKCLDFEILGQRTFFWKSLEDLLDRENGYILENGRLAIEVDIRVVKKEKKPLWCPKIGSKDVQLLKIMDSNEETDGRFRVGEETYPVYRCMLLAKASVLHELVRSAEGDEVEISGVDSSMFECLLRFIYGWEVPAPDFVETHGRSLITVADRFGANQLKLYVESEISRLHVNADSAAEWVVFADSHSCALLKETAINTFAFDADKVMLTPAWETVKESKELLAELIDALANRGEKRTYVFNDHGYVDVDEMDVSNLREKLEADGQHDALDGTREMMVKRLKRN
mmetsp:Transcript_9624/g.14134  ORF Transcript_9624/g.14134 Transcript_9624/m.14134 type:complete len:401 (-) Transcript_9624:331-1533(-)